MTRTARRTALAAALLLGAPAGRAFAGPRLESANNAVVRSAATAGAGSTVSSTNNKIIPALAEGIASSTAPAAGGDVSGAGYSQIAHFPGTVSDLAARAGVSASSATLAWTSPGYDGGLGALASGSTYFLQVDLPGAVSFQDYRLSRISFSTSATAPGIAVGTGATGLLANTTYWAQLWTIDAAGDLSYGSNVTTFTTLAAAPAVLPPTFVTVGLSSVTVIWSASGNPLAVTTYTVALSTDSAYPNSDSGNVVFATVPTGPYPAASASGLDSGRTYFLFVRAVNYQGSATDFIALGSTVMAAEPGAAGRYWVGGTGNWSDTAHWSSMSGGAGGASIPSASDNVHFDAASGGGTATVDAAAACADLDFTGYAGTFAGNQALSIYGSLTMGIGMTRTYTGALTFAATSPGKSLTFNGKAMASATTFNGPGGGWTLLDDWNNGASAITLTAGTLDTNGRAVTTTGVFSISGTATRSLSLSTSTLSFGTWTATVITNLSFDAAASTVTVTGNTTFSGGGLAYNGVQLNGSANTVTGANVFAALTRTGTAATTNTLTFSNDQTVGSLTLTGNSTINRVLIQSSVKGSSRTLTAAVVSASNADFEDAGGAGAANWNLSAIPGLSGDAGGNYGIVFTPVQTGYWVGGPGNWSASSQWASSSGGGGGSGRVPLPQDDAVFDAGSFSGAGQTVIANMPRLGKNLTFAAATNTPTITFNTAASLFGSLTLGPVTLGAGATLLTFEGRSSFALTSAGLTFDKPLTFDAPGGTLTLGDNLTLTAARTLTINNGAIVANGKNVSAGLVSSSNSNIRTVALGTGTWTLSGTGVVWNFATVTNLTLNQSTATVKLTDNSATLKTFSGGGLTYGSFWNATQGAGKVLIAGSNAFVGFAIDPGRDTQFTAGTTQTVSSFTALGAAGNAITLESSSAAIFTLTKAGGGAVSGDYLNVSNSAANPPSTWYAGAHSTDGGGNTGWTFTTPPAGANRFWVGGTGNWSATAHWSATSGGAGGASVPTALDSARFDAGSGAGTATVDVAAQCIDLDFTGYTGTFAGAQALTIAGSLTLGSGMTRTYTGAITFDATTPGKTLAFAGKTLASAVTFNGPGGGWTLQDDWNDGAAAVTLTAGALDTNGKTVTTTGILSISGSSSRGLTLGASTLNVGTWTATTIANLSFDAGGSTITVTGATTFNGGGLAYNGVQLNGAANTIVGTNVFAALTRTGTAATTNTLILSNDQTVTGTLTLTGNSTINRVLIESSVKGGPRTLSAASVSAANVDFEDIAAAGSANWNLSAIAGLSGDAGGNSGVTFTAAQTGFWVGGTGTWSTLARWASSSGGGSSSGRVPLPQDDAVFDGSSFSGAGQTVTANMPRLGKNLTFAAATNAPTITFNTTASLFGSLTLGPVTLGVGATVLTFEGRSAFALTSAGLTFDKPLTFDAPGGTLTLADDLTLTAARTLTINNGAFAANGHNVAAGLVSSSNSNIRTVTMGAGTWTLSGTGVVWNFATVTNLTLNQNSSAIKLTDNSATLKTFSGGGLAYGSFWNATQGAGKVLIAGSNAFAGFTIDPGRDTQFTAGTTQTVSTFTALGAAGNAITLESSSAAIFTLTKPGGGAVSGDYLNVSNSAANPPSTWYAGANSSDGGGNTGWIFSAAPMHPTALLCEGTSNPKAVVSVDPAFSAIFNAFDAGDTANYYRIQVASDSAFASPVWDSGKTATASCAEGTRCADIVYGGPTPLDTGKRWYYRIRFWDAGGTQGDWSDSGDYFQMLSLSIDRYWVGGAGNWSDPAHWSDTSGGAGGASVPTALDNAHLDASSGGGTAAVDVAASCADLDFTGYTGAFAGAQPLNVYGSLTLEAAMTFPFTGAITFGAVTAGKTLTLAGNALANAVTFNGSGGNWTLLDDWNNGAAAITLTAGTLNTNGHTVATSGIFSVSGAAPRALTLSTSTLNVGTWTATAVTNLSFDPGGSTIAVTGATTFNGGGLTYAGVQLNGLTNTIAGTNAFATLTRTGTAATTNALILSAYQTVTGTLNLTGNSATNRLLVQSSVRGSPIHLTAASISAANVDFEDITALGSANWDLSVITGLSGDAGGNTGIVFTPVQADYWIGDTGNWSTLAGWASSSGGGAASGRVPLPQDDAVFDANSFSGAGKTVTADMPRLGRNLNFAAATHAPTVSFNTTASIFGSLTLGPLTLAASTRVLTFEGRAAYALTSAGLTFPQPLTLDASGGSLTLADDLSLTAARAITITNGAFAANGMNVTAGSVSSNSSNVRGVAMGSGTWTLSGTGTVWNLATVTNLAFDAGASTVKLTDNSATLKTFSGGGLTYGTFWNATQSSGKVVIAGSNVFGAFTIDPGGDTQFTAGTTQTVALFTAVGTAGSPITLESTTAAPFTLAKTGDDLVSSDHLAISNSNAGPAGAWFAGANSVDGGGNSGWIFTAAPAAPGAPAVAAVYLSSIAVTWAPVGADGYVLAASTGAWPNSFGGNVSSTTAGAASGLAALSLDPNTTYYLRAGATWGAVTHYAGVAPTATLAAPPQPGALQFLSIRGSSVVVAWAALAQSPPDASSKTCEGYVLLASSNDFGALAPAGAPLFSTATADVLTSTLTIGSEAAPLDLSNTYYFQVGSLNWAGAPNYTPLQRLNFQISQSTDHLSYGAIDPFVALSTISTSSMVVTNVGNWPVTIALTASTATLPSSPWALSTSPGIDTVALLGVWSAGAIGPSAAAFNTYLTTSTALSQPSGNYSSASQNGYQLAPGANISLWVRLFLPTSSSTVGPERLRVLAEAVYP